MTSQPTSELQLRPLPENRIAELGPEFFQALGQSATYASTEEALDIRRATYNGMPQKLSINEVVALTNFVGREAQTELGSVDRGLKTVETTQIKMLQWLDRMSELRGDKRTTINVKRELAAFPVIKRAIIRFKTGF